MRLKRARPLHTVRREVRPRRFGAWWRPPAPGAAPPPPPPDPVLPRPVEESTAEAELVPLPPEPHRVADWGPLTRMGQHLRVQAQVGYRAAVVELDPGLYLVAEVPEEALRPVFGAMPLLGTLLVQAASMALSRRLQTALQPAPQPAVAPVPPPAPAQPRWATPEVVDTVAGACCPRCGGR